MELPGRHEVTKHKVGRDDQVPGDPSDSGGDEDVPVSRREPCSITRSAESMDLWSCSMFYLLTSSAIADEFAHFVLVALGWLL